VGHDFFDEKGGAALGDGVGVVNRNVFDERPMEAEQVDQEEVWSAIR
jgi:hypothetical protein